MRVLVGPPASGKTTWRGAQVASGLPAHSVVSLDDLRREIAADTAARGGPVRPPQDWTLPALRRAAARQAALLTAGTGYLADSTHLRRRERVAHVRAAHAAGLPAVAVLMPDLPLDVLRSRNAARDADTRVPEELLRRHAHRRSLLSRQLLLDEGFNEVVEPAQPAALDDRFSRDDRRYGPGNRRRQVENMTGPDSAQQDPQEQSPDVPGVSGDARLHDLGGNTGPSPSSSRGGGGLGPSAVREADERAREDEQREQAD